MAKMETDNYSKTSYENKTPSVTWEDYVRAEKYLPQNIGKLVFKLRVTPNWAGKDDCFWYKIDTRQGKQFVYVDPSKNTREPAFDHIALASQLSKATKLAYTHTNLPFDKFEYADSSLKAIKVEANQTRWQFGLETGELSESGDSGSTEDVNPQKPAEIVSPDEKWAVFVKDYNLYLKCKKTGIETQITFDGDEKHHYASPFENPLLSAGIMKRDNTSFFMRPSVSWSPDSKKILTYKIDHEDIGECFLVQSCPFDGTKRPKLHRYTYPLPGDENVPMAQPFVINLENVMGSAGEPGEPVQVKIDVEPQQLLYYGAPRCWTHWSTGDRERIYFMRRERGYNVKRLYVTDPKTGSTQILLEEQSPTAVEHYSPKAVDDGKSIVWHSEEDGWAHLYLYDGITGKLRNRVTSGPWVVREIHHVDELSGTMYFSASGKEPGRNPYYKHLYSVKLDGTGLQLLTPEDAEHEITFTPSGNYFLDRYSRVDLAPVTVLRKADGTFLTELEKADLGLLQQTGWSFPERFSVKARDGVTDLYGMIVRPSNFDPNRSYPIIEANYSGPQTVRTPLSFADGSGSRQFWQDQAIAELGFIVVTVDGLGMAFRSKAFQDYSYRDLGDAGMPDHIVAFRQLANRYPYMDISRVGIYGGSAGGYGAARAILAHPDFFKVAVVWAGNHDHRTDKASWIERYMGLPVGPHYEEQANPTLARNLKGKMFIMHGEMDENVPPAASLQLVDALIKANKDFDFLILPNGQHADGYHPYITRKRWDYFVQHLLGATPPEGYTISG